MKQHRDPFSLKKHIEITLGAGFANLPGILLGSMLIFLACAIIRDFVLKHGWMMILEYVGAVIVAPFAILTLVYVAGLAIRLVAYLFRKLQDAAA